MTKPSFPLRAGVVALSLTLLAGGAVRAADTPAPAASEAQQNGANAEALLGTLVTLIQTLVDQGVLSPGKAQEMLRQAGIDPSVLTTATQPPVSPVVSVKAEAPVVRVPYVPQLLKDELREELKQQVLTQARTERWVEAGILPSWINRLRFYGDMRFRIEREDYASGNATPQEIDAYYQLPLGTTLTTEQSRNRPRLRARLGVDAAIDEHVSADIMVLTTTGDDATASPVSFNSDQGRYSRPFSAGIDVAYLQWAP
ncbi:MAG TPA: putative porin, partial [Burkholderiaceae bacterium]|nr:putative porin [Burkholderiaceae bacterium]